MKKRCAQCGFTFNASDKGRPALVCPNCRKRRVDKWRASQKPKEDKQKKEQKYDSF